MSSGLGQPTPAGAISGGQENDQERYVCRAPFNGGLHPGKLIGGRCNIGWGGKGYELNTYEVLTGTQDTRLWAGRNTTKGYVGGHEADGRPLVICVAYRKEGFLGLGTPSRHPGKLLAWRCNYEYGGEEVEGDNYSVITTSFNSDVDKLAPLTNCTFRVRDRNGLEKEHKILALDAAQCSWTCTHYADPGPAVDTFCLGSSFTP